VKASVVQLKRTAAPSKGIKCEIFMFGCPLEVKF
jgi:hypothetical protein